MLRVLLILLFLLPALGSFAQKGSFRALHLPANARTAAMGGYNAAMTHEDVNMSVDNPALLMPDMHLHTAFNYYRYNAGADYTSLAYAHRLGKAGMVGGGIQYLSYGQLEGYDPTGQATYPFTAADYVIKGIYSHQIGPFRLGGALNYAVSSYGEYQAHLLATDLGGTFVHPEKDLTIGLVVKNLGLVLNDFTGSNQSSAPMDVQAGIAFKPEFMPFRFSFTAYNLNDWRIRPVTEEEAENRTPADYASIYMKHLAFGTELLLHKNFHIRAGYNHRRRSELNLSQKRTMAGFAYGFLFRKRAFQLAYTRSVYHAAAGTHFFSLGADLSKWFMRKP